MFTIDLSSILCNSVEIFIDRETPPTWNGDGTITKKGILYGFNYTVSDFDKDKSVTKSIYVMFCGGTNVFYTHLENYCDPTEISPKNWINTSNHDSCWRSDGLDFINKDYFEMCKEVNPDKAPIMLSNYVNLFSIKPKKVIITYKYDSNGYKNEITKVEYE